ncbi:helix-turn-helix domain-containing protein [Neobacillus sp. NPDC097160]
MMNMHRSTVSRYENGKAIPNYQTVIRLAEVFFCGRYCRL